MTAVTLPPLHIAEAPPSAAEQTLRWTLVVALHGLLLWGVLVVSVRQEILTLPPSIAVRLLPLLEEKKPDPPPPPKPQVPLRKPPPPAAQPILAAVPRAEAPASFVVPAQPPAPPPAPITAPPAPPSPLPVVAARFDANYLHNPKPVYPAIARRNGEEGKVLLKVRVSADGNALDVEVKQSSGYPRLDTAAREAVQRWRFVAARRGDEVVESSVVVPITFSLE
ncbi:MAG TPA: energy transducer TonB [Myxococcota bacterium]|nr:energy transducer TonB [Myxococcota bacterium]